MKRAACWLMIFVAAAVCSGATAQSVTGQLMKGDALDVPYSGRASVFLEKDDQLLNQSAISGEDGTFLIEDIAPDTYSVFIAADKRGRVVIPDVAVSEGRVTDSGMIPLHLECALTGTVKTLIFFCILNRSVMLLNETGQCELFLDVMPDWDKRSIHG